MNSICVYIGVKDFSWVVMDDRHRYVNGGAMDLTFGVKKPQDVDLACALTTWTKLNLVRRFQTSPLDELVVFHKKSYHERMLACVIASQWHPNKSTITPLSTATTNYHQYLCMRLGTPVTNDELAIARALSVRGNWIIREDKLPKLARAICLSVYFFSTSSPQPNPPPKKRRVHFQQ